MRSSPSLDALAHPVRLRVFTTLRERGSGTASDLARDLGTHTGATSYHLRRLAEAGLVAEAPTSVGRRRVWQPAHETGPWQAAEPPADSDAETMLSWVDRDLLRHATEHTDRWLAHRETWPQDWSAELGIDDDYVVATAAQIGELRAELRATIERYRRIGQGNPGARRIAIWTGSYPVDLHRPPKGGTSSGRSPRQTA
ncbi:MAG: helix-turn-helix domain-containing protein [Nostocoides sp.]